ncbi:hypothetical protein VaNZ11_004539 [Volvox africanus]|uniref:Chloride channel protein n=1 Tax=Volvox africanus TaxID=51714 RepID=A0ABQ5RXH8_9CHLO|nr:hypothetical protein VaNZ11_004539 [Volvox africanus]
MDGSTGLDPASRDGVRNMGQAGVSAGASPVTATSLPARRDIREAKRRLKEAETLRSKFTRYRANDYAVEESDLRRSLILNTTESQFRWDKAFSWLLSLIIGVLNGIVGFLFTEGINWLNRAKFETTLKVIRPHDTGIFSYLVYLTFSLLYALAGALLGSYVSPQAAGSGIPEIRCYLNGIHVRGLLTVRTFFAKSIGVVLSVASGLLVGKEGPFTHVGAIIGGGVGHLGSTSLTRATNGHLRAVLHTRFGRYFKSAVSHRDYVAAGAASGVASAFAAPLGGILFSVEQGASFYNFEMLSHAFLSAGIAVYVNALLQAAFSQGSSLYKTAMATKQAFVMLSKVPDNTRLWYYSWELPIFAVMGMLGGLLGAAMVILNNAVTRFRRRFIPPTKPARRVAEVLLLATLTATAWFLASYLSPCAHYPPKYLVINNQGNNTGLGDPVVLFGGYYPQLWCPEGQYSEFGMLFFMPQMTSITMLFQYQLPNGASFIYSVGALASLFMLGWLFMTLTFGIGAVTGLFVPSLLVGGAGGRLMGRLVRAVVLYLGYHKDDGTGAINICLSAYAIVGAGSVLGGVSRMLLCNTVLVMETAAASTLIMPLIVTTFIAKAVADLLTPVGIFDLAIQRAGYPYLEAELTDLTDIKLQYALTAGDVMSSQLATLPALLPIGELVEMLRRYPNFSTFPLTEPAAGVETDDVVCPETALSAPSNGPGEAAPSDGAGGTHNIGNAAVIASIPPTRSSRSLGGLTERDAAEHASVKPSKIVATTVMPTAKCTGGAADAQQNSCRGPLAEATSLPDTSSSSTGAASEERREEAEERLRGPLAAVTALVPAPAPSGSWYPFQRPHYLQPRGGTSFLSAFAGGAAVAAAAAAAAMPGALPAEMLRVMGRGYHGEGAGWGSGDQAERLQGAGPFGLRSVPAPLPLPSPPHRPAAEKKLAAAGPSAALISECKAVLGEGSEAVGCSAERVGGGGGGHAAVAATPPPLVPPADSFCQPAQARSDRGIIIGTISRSVLLKLLEMQIELRAMTQSGPSAADNDAAEGLSRTTDGEAGGGNDAAGIPSWLIRRHAAMSRKRAAQLMDALDNHPVKAPRDRDAEEALFVRLEPQDMATYLDLRHYMQRVPYIVPATASLARTYRLFRGLGLHHIFVTQPSVPIIGLITRTNIAPANAYKVAYDLAQMEQAQLQALLRQEPVQQEAYVRVDEGCAGGGGGGGGGDGGGGGSGGDDGGKGIIDATAPVVAQQHSGQQPKYQMAYRASFQRGTRVLGCPEAAAARDGASQPLQQPHRWSLGGTVDACVPGDRNVHERDAGGTLAPGREAFQMSDASDRMPAFCRQNSGEQLLRLPPSRRRTDPGIRPLARQHSGDGRNLRADVGPALDPDEQQDRVNWVMPDVTAGAAVMDPARGPRSSGQQQVSGEEAPAASRVFAGGGGGGGGVCSRPSPRQDFAYLRINLARSGRELDGGAGLISGTNTPMGEGNVRYQRSASSAASSDVDRIIAVETGAGAPQLSYRGLRRRNPTQRSHYPGGTDMASTAMEPMRREDTMCGQVWPMATPFSTLVFGGGGSGDGGGGNGGVSRRATTQAACGADVAAAALQGVRNPRRWGQVGRVLSRVLSNEPPDEEKGASDGGGGGNGGHAADVEAPPQPPGFRPEGVALQQTGYMSAGEDTTPRRIHTVLSEAVKALIKTAKVGPRADTNSESPPVQQDIATLVSGEDQQQEQGQIQRPQVLQRLQLQVSRKVRGGGAIADFVKPSVPAPAPPVETLLAKTFLTSSPPPPSQPSIQAPLLPMSPRQLRGEGAMSLLPLSPAPQRGPTSDDATLLPLPASRLQQAAWAVDGTADRVAAGGDTQRSSGGSPGAEGAPEP